MTSHLHNASTTQGSFLYPAHTHNCWHHVVSGPLEEMPFPYTHAPVTQVTVTVHLYYHLTGLGIT